jgi:hypothetical protein
MAFCIGVVILSIKNCKENLKYLFSLLLAATVAFQLSKTFFQFSTLKANPYHSLDFSTKVAKHLSMLNKGVFRVQINENTFAHPVHGIILYLLGRDFHNQITYWDKIVEFNETVQSRSLSKQTLLIECPRPLGKGRERYLTALEKSWNIDENMQIKDCHSCSKCLFLLMTPKDHITLFKKSAIVYE